MIKEDETEVDQITIMIDKTAYKDAKGLESAFSDIARICAQGGRPIRQ